MRLTPKDVFGADGCIARRLPQYETREQQVEMARAVANAIQAKEHLIIEAGTGVGKSFGYLVPAILSTQNEGDAKPRKVVVSTHTISLQEQLIGRDIPFLNAVMPVEFSAVLVKGRGNYMSLRRMKGAYEKSRTLFETEQMQQVERLRAWSETTTDGSRADLNFAPDPKVWDEVRSEHGNCLGKKCPTYNDCFYYKARRRIWNADVLVVNHALFFSDLALRREGASILPEYDIAIFDEAHTLEDVAASHMGMQVSNGQFTYLLNKLYNDRTNKGLLLHHNLVEGQQLVNRLRFLVDSLFDEVDQWRNRNDSNNGRVRKEIGVKNIVSDDTHDLAMMIRDYASDIRSEEQRIELNAQADRLDMLGSSLASWLKLSEEEAVYWVETSGTRSRNISLMSSPTNIGDVLRDELFGRVNSVILTSATLSVGQEDFGFFKHRLGLTKSNELKLGSPFNYREQVELIIADDMPDPSRNPREFDQAACERIQQYISDVDGGVFVLFTSYRMLRNCASRLSGWMGQQNRQLLCQGAGLQRTTLLDRFRKDGRAVLFGTETFWQGVDVPGDALSCVIITKLPFSVPDHPLLEARIEQIRERGGNPFMEYQVPEAAIKLRQGFGRLIRTATDEGRVVILDPRITSKPYGRVFFESLPECRTVISSRND